MDVTLSEEQHSLVAATRSFAERFATTHGTLRPDGAATAPAPEADVAGGVAGLNGAPAEAWRVAVEMGLPALLVPEALGGAGARVLDAALVAEETARRLVPVPLLGTLLATGLCAAAGTVPPAEDAACVVLDRGLLGLAPHGVAWDWTEGSHVIAVRDAIGRGSGDTGLTVVETTADLADRLDGIDPLHPLAAVRPYAASGGMGGGGSGEESTDARGDRWGTEWCIGAVSAEGLTRWRALALALVCADLVGTMTGALEAAVEHAKVREQFGRPIGSFQAVQQLAAEQHVLVEGARSCTWHAAWAADALPPDEAEQAARVAKAYCSEIARPVTEAAIQIWGGLGMTWECVAHLYLRRALLGRRTLGDENHHLAAIAQERLSASSP